MSFMMNIIDLISCLELLKVMGPGRNLRSIKNGRGV